MSRNLSASNIAWDSRDDAAVAELLRAEGFTGVEIAPTVRWAAPLDVPAADVAAYREWWEERGLPIVALQSLLYGRPDLVLFGPEPARRALVEYLIGIIELAAQLGARALVFGSPANRRRGPMPMAEAIEIAVEFFREVGTVAAAHGTVLCLEPNPPEYGCDFITTTAAAVAMVERVGSAGVMVQGDLGAMTIVSDPPATAIALAGVSLAHFHASEPDLAELGSTPSGVGPHEDAARALHERGYDGWVSIEMRRVDDRATSVERVRRAAALVRRVYAET